MSTESTSSSQPLNGAGLSNHPISNGPDPHPALEIHAREAPALEDVVTQFSVEAAPSDEATQPATQPCGSTKGTKLAREEPALEEKRHSLSNAPTEEATQPFTQPYGPTKGTKLAREEPAPEACSSQLPPKLQPSDKTIQPRTRSSPVSSERVHTKEEPVLPNLGTKLLAQASSLAQPVNNSSIIPEKEGHSLSNATPEEATQPCTQLCAPTKGTELAREEPTSQKQTAEQLTEVSSSEQSSEEFLALSPPCVLPQDSTDTPEAIEAMKTMVRNHQSSKKPKLTSKPSKLSQYGYTAQTIESETKDDIAALLRYAHARVPDARLVISHRSEFKKGKEMSSSSAIIRPEQPLGGRDTFGVVHRTQDVYFTIDLLPPRMSYEVKCRIIYQPDSDNCVLVNHTDFRIYLASLDPTQLDGRNVRPYDSIIIKPGVLSISFDDIDYKDCKHIVELILLKRQFDISIAKSDNHAPHKRAITDIGDETKSAKRQKLENGEAGNTTSRSHSAVTTSQSCSAATDDSVTSESHHKNAARILELADGETATICSLTPKRHGRVIPMVEPSYQLRRQNEIHKTANSIVFTALHSKIAKAVVVKMPGPGFQEPDRAEWHVMLWKREKTILEKLSHPNVVKLMAFDGRILALCLEELPQSLFCGRFSTFQPLDAFKILHDIASALEYITTKQIVHNDIKPINIAYRPDRGAVLLDFGTATSFGEDPPQSTKWYLPPEYFKRWTRNSPGDVFALGVVMLYVSHKIQHPDRPSNNWRVDNGYMDGNSKAYWKAQRWLRYIADKRAELNRMDRVESLMYRMLEEEPTRRIKAAAIVAELQPEVGTH
ncbi:kinase-like domain-containing protein [Trichoderma chlorosporum]